MNIIVNEFENNQTDIYLMDGEKIIDYKINTQSHLVKDFIIKLSIRYSLSKETQVNNRKDITLDEYMR